MPRSVVLVAVLCMVLIPAMSRAAAAPQPAPSALPSLNIPFERHVLPNGLILIVHEDHDTPIASVSMWYRVGGRDELPGRAGFAHLFEHINASSSLEQAVEEAGLIASNASTRNDYTNYYETVPSQALDTALWLESQRMGAMLEHYTQQKLDAEREIVKGEKRFTNSRVPDRAAEAELLWRQTYPARHPYSWSGMGSDAELDAATLEDVKDWYRTWHGAANAILVVAGDVVAAQVKQRVEHYFGALPAGPAISRITSWIAPMTERRRMVSRRVGITGARLYKVWNVPGYASRDFVLLQLTAAVLGGAQSALRKRLMTSELGVTELTVKTGGMQLGSQFKITATLAQPERLAAVEAALDQELEHFLQVGPTPEELQRAITSDYVETARALEQVDANGGKSYSLALGELYAGRPDFHTLTGDWKRSATSAQVRSVAQRWLAGGDFVLSVLPEPPRVMAVAGEKPSRPPVPTQLPMVTLPTVQRATLPNGLQVALIERPAARLLRMSMIFGPGNLPAGAQGIATAQLAAQMMLQGTQSSTAQQIAQRAESLGADLTSEASVNGVTLALVTPVTRLAESVELFSDVLLRPRFDPAAFATTRREWVASAKLKAGEAERIALRTFARKVFSSEPERESLLTEVVEAGAMEALSVEDLRRFHQQVVRPCHGTLLVVGDVKLERIMALLRDQLANWRPAAGTAEPVDLSASSTSQHHGPARTTAPSTTLPAHDPNAKPDARARIYLVDVGGVDQTEIVAGGKTLGRGAPDFDGLALLNDVLHERLTESLREVKQLTYDADVKVRPMHTDSPIVIRTVVSTKRTAEAVQELVAQLRDMSGSNGPTEAELERMRRKLILSLPGRFETAGQVTMAMDTVLQFGLADDYWNTYGQRLSRLTPSQLHQWADRWLQPRELLWVLVGDVGKFEAQVRAARLGEVVVLDKDGKVLR